MTERAAPLISEFARRERPAVPVGARIKFAHHGFRLADGRPVGVSVGGHGVPLVFFHGIGMHRRIYLKLLSRLPQLGFMVVAVDAPGHGDSFIPDADAVTFAARMTATQQILDTLGIDRAVLVGHSMGGRTVAEIAAIKSDQALAAVLIDPAVGSDFDASRARIASPRDTAAGLAGAMRDSVVDHIGLRRRDRLKHLGMLGGLALSHAIRPRPFMAAATAIATSSESSVALKLMRDNAVPSAVVHGERDLIVSMPSAIDAATLSESTLVTLPEAYHSWVLASPWTFTQILHHLVISGRLGEEVQHAVAVQRASPEDYLKTQRYIRTDAPVFTMVPPVEIIGHAEPRRAKFYHHYRIWDQLPTSWPVEPARQ
jgi:pimeloyl-ACP methyl ester carboxylesterase